MLSNRLHALHITLWPFMAIYGPKDHHHRSHQRSTTPRRSVWWTCSVGSGSHTTQPRATVRETTEGRSTETRRLEKPYIFSMDPMIFRHRCGKTMKDIHKHLAAMFFITRSIVGKFLVDGLWGWDNLIAGGYEIPALWFNGWVSCGFVKKNMWETMVTMKYASSFSPLRVAAMFKVCPGLVSGGLQSVVSGLGGGSMGCF